MIEQIIEPNKITKKPPAQFKYNPAIEKRITSPRPKPSFLRKITGMKYINKKKAKKVPKPIK